MSAGPILRPVRAARGLQRGAALLLAMIVMALVAVVTAGMVWQQERAITIEAAERARSQAAWILNGALDWSRLILREDQRNNRGGPGVDSLNEPWAQPLAEARLSTFLAADKDNNADGGPEAFLSGAIEDAQSRWNLRVLVDDAGKVVPVQLAALERLTGLAGVPTDTAQRIAQGLAAAMAPPGGDPTRNPPLRPVQLSDLSWLGIDPAVIERLAPYVDLLPQPTPVNVNTAPRETLVAAVDGLDLGGAERIVQARQRKPIRDLAELQALTPGLNFDPARVSVNSSHFRVAGRLRLEDRVLEERSLLVRRDNRVEVLRREKRSFAASSR